MMMLSGIELGDGMAQIGGTEVVSEGSVFLPTEGYVYCEGDATDATHFLNQNEGAWEVMEKPVFSLQESIINSTVNVEIVIDVGEPNVEVFIDNVSHGVNIDTTIEFTAETAGTYSLRFEKFPFVPSEVVVHAV